MSEVPSRGKPELCEVSISALRMGLGKAMGSVWPTAHKRTDGDRFRGNAGEDIKGISGDNVRKVRDYGNAVPGTGSLIRGSVNRWSRMRKSRGRVRT